MVRGLPCHFGCGNPGSTERSVLVSFRGGHDSDLSFPEGKYSVQVIQVSKYEIQISELAGPTEIIHTVAHEACRRWRIFPAIDSVPGSGILGLATVPHQSFRDPGTTHFVFLAELTAAPCPNQGNSLVTTD